MIADEPTGALDSHSGEEVMAILHQLRDQGAHGHYRDSRSAGGGGAERIIQIHDGELVSNPPPRASRAAALKRSLACCNRLGTVFQRFSRGADHGRLAMAANKMRTLLTMLGIIIGIASVVSIVVVGDAAKQLVLADIRAIGTSTIDVIGKDFGDDEPQYQQALKYDDLAAIQKQPWSQFGDACRRKTFACAWVTWTLPARMASAAEIISTSTA